MINFMVLNVREGSSRYDPRKGKLLAKCQIENSLQCGWKPEEIVLLSNLDFSYMGVRAKIRKLTDTCLTGSKVFGLKAWFQDHPPTETYWAHDLDAWQNVPFEEPEIRGDVGICRYSNSKINGGSIFWKPTAIDILHSVVDLIETTGDTREEPALNRILKSSRVKHRVTYLDQGFNVGCSGFAKRFIEAEKPVKVCHFHPYNVIAWETQVLDRNGLGEVPVSVRLERLIRKYYRNLATTLSAKGRAARDLKRKKREEEKNG